MLEPLVLMTHALERGFEGVNLLEPFDLLEQIFVVDGETKVKAVIEMAAKDAGSAIALTAFSQYNLGEGVEKEETDFAAEVAAQLGG